jgi:hypothetical protein
VQHLCPLQCPAGLPPVLFCSVLFLSPSLALSPSSALSLSQTLYRGPGEGRGLVPVALCVYERESARERGRTEGHCHFELGINLHGAFWPRADGSLPLLWTTTVPRALCAIHHRMTYSTYVGVGTFVGVLRV